MSTHTPGPWRAVEEPHTADPGHMYWHIQAGDGYLDPDVPEQATGFELAGFMTPADAALIIASPDLLHALSVLVGPNGINMDRVSEGLQLARAAMAKAGRRIS